jgi:hypothetical protein
MDFFHPKQNKISDMQTKFFKYVQKADSTALLLHFHD